MVYDVSSECLWSFTDVDVASCYKREGLGCREIGQDVSKGTNTWYFATVARRLCSSRARGWPSSIASSLLMTSRGRLASRRTRVGLHLPTLGVNPSSFPTPIVLALEVLSPIRAVSRPSKAVLLTPPPHLTTTAYRKPSAKFYSRFIGR